MHGPNKNEIMNQLRTSFGKTVKINPIAVHQAALFPEPIPLLDELKELYINGLFPIEVLNKLFEGKKKFIKKARS
jgi:DNA mismatch repair protein MutS